MRYPQAEWVPWGYGPLPTYYRGLNKPVAVVLHIMQGYASTARVWAHNGYFGASWHFTVARDGSVMQHLDFADGGYHAGIAEYRENGARNPRPTWPLWRGWAQNINNYTIGIEHEGFAGTPFTPIQAAASRDLCRWLAEVLRVPYDRDHFPPHADIALIDRANDFNVPALREAHYQFMFQEGDMCTKCGELEQRIDRMERVFTGSADPLARAISFNEWNYKRVSPDEWKWDEKKPTGYTLLGGYWDVKKRLGELAATVQRMADTGAMGDTIDWDGFRKEAQDIADWAARQAQQGAPK